jgi:hypothetical protein
MRITWKGIALLVVCVILGGGVYMGYQCWRAWQLFCAEDQIAHTFYPLVEAIYRHAETHGHPPAHLADLVPGTLPSIPTCPVVDSIVYGVHPDGTTWRLALRSHVCGIPRIHCWQSDHKYRREEEARVLGRYHGGWTVMKEKG